MVSGGVCVGCNSDQYYDGTDTSCHLCDASIAGCTSCQINASSILQCFSCDASLQLELSSNLCNSCNSSAYFDSGDGSCHSCSSYCVSCTSAADCFECESTNVTSTKLQDGVCVVCNPDAANTNSGLPYCGSYVPIQCVMSIYNPDTGQCDPVQVSETVMNSFTMIASIPTVSMFTQTFVSLVGLFDDLSYYTYHGRNYSDVVEVFFTEMTNFTMSRFIPFQLDSVYDQILVNYSAAILCEDLDRTPPEFRENDGDVYFLDNTEQIWTFSLPLSVVLFALFYGVHLLVNKCVKTNLFKSYNYFLMILVDQVGSNVQYFSFRAFSQFYQLVPLGPTYYANVAICYSVLFVVLLYSVASPLLFAAVYSRASFEYILFDLFGQSWVVLFAVSNLLKMFTGFVHAYFYYAPMVQTALLTVSYLVKSVFYTFAIKHIHSRF